MIQGNFDFELTGFELATLEQLVSYKAAKDKDVERLMGCDKLKSEVRLMVSRWNKKRIKLGLIPFK